MRLAKSLLASLALVQACTSQTALDPSSHAADQLKDKWRACVLVNAKLFSRSTEEVGMVMQAAFNACQSDENALIEAFTATAKGMLSDKDLRKIRRQSIHDSAIKVVVNSRAQRGIRGS